MKKSINLTAIFVKDKDGGYTSFFAQFPNIVAEGQTEDEAAENLFALVQTVFEHQQEEEIEATKNSGSMHVKTRSFNLATA